MSKIPAAKPPNGTFPARPMIQRLVGPPLVAVVATVASLATLAPEAGGPGITCDELYHVATGKRLVGALREQGFGFFAADNIRRNFPWKPGGPPMHPPLGNWILGAAHHLFDPDPDNPSSVSIVPARLGMGLTFGLLVLLVGLATARAEGSTAGTAAAAAVVLVPRMFGHSHLAGLDPITALFCTAALFAVIKAEERGGRWWPFALAGALWGLAMLSRLHGLLLGPPIVLWLAWRMRRRALLPLAAWGAAGAATFFAGWPWLWLAPVEHMKQFLGTATHRQSVHVYYMGRLWDDVNVPWHYPWVMFVVALPLGLLLLGLVGLWAKRHDFRPAPGFVLLIGTLVWMLSVFSWPGTPVYDGVRLFLPVFPLWAVSVGVGVAWVIERPAWQRFPLAARRLAMGLFIALQGVGLIVHHPCQLSHYSLLIGGLAGANRVGMEATYWGDSVSEPLLAEAARRAPGGRILFAPNLAPFQSPAVEASSPSLATAKVRVVGWDPAHPDLAAGCRFAVLYNRKADLAVIPPPWWEGDILMEHQQQGVWLARLIRLPEPVGAAVRRGVRGAKE